MAEERKTYPEIAERLISVRTGMTDLNQSHFAIKHAFGVSQYANWETGTRRIPIEAAEKLCDFYGLTLDAIYRGRVTSKTECVDGYKPDFPDVERRLLSLFARLTDEEKETVLVSIRKLLEFGDSP